MRACLLCPPVERQLAPLLGAQSPIRANRGARRPQEKMKRFLSRRLRQIAEMRIPRRLHVNRILPGLGRARATKTVRGLSRESLGRDDSFGGGSGASPMARA